MSEQRYQAVLAVIAEGWTVTEVAARFGVSRQTLHAWLAKYEAGMEAAELCVTGLSLAEVADRYRIDAQTASDERGSPVRTRRGWSRCVRSKREQR